MSGPVIPPAAGPRSDLYPPLAVPAQPLRIGLLVDGERVTAWVARIVEQIEASGFATVALVVVNAEQRPRPSLLDRIRNKLRNLSYDKYTQWDSGKYRGADSPFAMKELAPMVKDAKWMSVCPERRGFVHRLTKADTKAIRAEKLDVLLRFGFNIIRGGILGAARHGVWSYHHDDSSEYRGGPAMFWEIFEGNPVTGTVLQRLSEELDAGGVIQASHAATHPLSLELNRAAAYWKASSFVMRCLRGLAQGNEPVPVPAGSYSKGLYRAPRNFRMLQFMGRVLSRRLRISLDRRLRVSHWFIAWRSGADRLDPDSPSFAGAREITAPKGHFYADPMLHRHDGQDWLLVEDFDYARNKGQLAAIRLHADGSHDSAQTIMDLDVHLSYPFVFEWKGDTYLLPEMAAAGRVSLFRARRFPEQWEFACDLLVGYRAVDATLHEQGGHWYMFANVCEAGGGTHDELFLFHAETPLGPFKPHPANPLVSDVRRARPAGPLFMHGGRLIRPAQDCAVSYGRALVFNEVLELTPSSYRERQLGRLDPAWADGLDGCHTYARCGDIEVVDGKRPTRRRTVGA